MLPSQVGHWHGHGNTGSTSGDQDREPDAAQRWQGRKRLPSHTGHGRALFFWGGRGGIGTDFALDEIGCLQCFILFSFILIIQFY